MKITALLTIGILTLSTLFSAASADSQPTAFEQALYAKARYQVLSHTSDEDLVSYCVSMNIGGDTLLKFHDEILAKQTELAILQGGGFADDNPQVTSVQGELKNLRSQYSVKIAEVRKALEIESSIADATLDSLAHYSK
jgi:capsule polysaccharide export protein KpsE/RkpR